MGVGEIWRWLTSQPYESIMVDRRDALETIQIIESALVERIKHSPLWLPSPLKTHMPNKGKALSIREIRAQQWDVRALLQLASDIVAATNESEVEGSPESFLRMVETLGDTDLEPRAPTADDLQRLQHARGLERLSCKFSKHTVNLEEKYSIQEEYGQCLDLIDLHMRYQSLPGAQPVSYRDYVENFAHLDPGNLSYLRSLRRYLESAFNRFHVLTPSVEQTVQYQEGMALIVDDPLWCSACEWLFSTEGVYTAHFTGKKHRRAVQKMPLSSTPNSSLSISSVDRGSPEECLRMIRILKTLLEPEIHNTLSNIDRRQGLTGRERELEADAKARQLAEEDVYISDSNSKETNKESFSGDTKFGADGKPIPYWLYKLQGLGHEFRCEICGGYTYTGRRDFERHFREERHRAGLRSIGIDLPSELFSGIVTVMEAQELSGGIRTNSPDPDVEVEDSEGNAMTRRVYEDLKRQGVL